MFLVDLTSYVGFINSTMFIRKPCKLLAKRIIIQVLESPMEYIFPSYMIENQLRENEACSD